MPPGSDTRGHARTRDLTRPAALGEVYFKIHMEEAFITKVTQKAAEDGGVQQTVEMVFETIYIDYAKQGTDKNNPGNLDALVSYDWGIPAGKASPATGA